MDGLTLALADDLPELGDLVPDEPFWRYPAGGGPGREDVAHLRVWLTAGPEPGYLAVVTETGPRSAGDRVASSSTGARPVGGGEM